MHALLFSHPATSLRTEEQIMSFSRRSFLKGAGAAGAAALVSGVRMPNALAQVTGERHVFVHVFMQGGYNALFPSAGSFMGDGTFGVSAGNVTNLGSDVIVDKSFFDGLSIANDNTHNTYLREHMGSVGVRHGSSDHDAGRAGYFMAGETSSGILKLAAAMGGDAPIKAARIGDMPLGNHAAAGGVSLQNIADMNATIAVLKGGDALEPRREVMPSATKQATAMSKGRLDKNPVNLRSDKEGRTALLATLEKAPPQIDFNTIPGFYGLAGVPNGISLNNFDAPMAAAELMVHAGANVICVTDNFRWDTHTDTDGTAVRNQMNQRVYKGLRTFINRMMVQKVGIPNVRVTLVIGGDFSRSLPGSDHASVLSCSIIGDHIKTGATGTVNSQVGLPVGTGSWAALWSLLADAAKLTTNPFGANNHKAKLLR
jgi:hypothetical protein